MANVRAIAHIALGRGYSQNERQTVLLIKKLAELGVKQMLICNARSPLVIHLKGVAGLTLLRLSGGDLRFNGHIKVGRRYPLVHAHDEEGAQWAFLHYMIFGVPYLISLRTPHFNASGLLNKALFLWARSVVCASEDIAHSVEVEAELDKVKVIANSIVAGKPDQRKVAEIRSAYGNRFIVGEVASFSNRKFGQATLIESVRILKTPIPSIVAFFIGDGDPRVLAEHASGMSNVKFLKLRYSTLREQIAALDVFVMPVNEGSEEELMLILDAMDLGVPVVTTDFAGVKTHVRDGVSGLIVPKNDPKALAAAILSLRDNPSLRDRLIANGRDEALKSSPEIMAMQYYDLYRTLLPDNPA